MRPPITLVPKDSRVDHASDGERVQKAADVALEKLRTTAGWTSSFMRRTRRGERSAHSFASHGRIPNITSKSNAGSEISKGRLGRCSKVTA